MLYFSGLPDFHEMHFLLRYLRAGDNFIDAGANIGTYTLMASSVIGNGTIEAFEAGSTEALVRNIALNGLRNVIVHAAAVTDHVGRCAFVEEESTELSHLATAGSHRRSLVDCTTLDAALGDREFAMAKVDVEGGEQLVLNGATRHLEARNPPVWQLELDGYSRRYGHETHEIVGWLRARGYETFVFDAEANALVRVDFPGERGRTNALAVAMEEVDRVAVRSGARLA